MRGSWSRPRLGSAALLTTLGLGVSGCGTTVLTHAPGLSGPQFLLGYGLLTFACLAVADALQRRLGSGPPVAPSDANLSPLEMAYLAGEASQVVQTSLLGLLQRREVTVKDGMVRCPTKPARELDAVEADLVKGLAAGQREAPTLLDATEAQEELFVPLRERLRSLELIKTAKQLAQARAITALMIGGLWLLGVARLIHGLEAKRPVGFLIAALILVALALLKKVGDVSHRTP